ncbi:MAG: acyl-CoA dehydrogenase family protein [Myxococcota bacterium]
MNFDLTEEQQMIVDQAAKFVANESPVERFRKLRETERGWEPAMWAKMAEQGWLSIAIPEEQGGFGGSFVDLALILEQLGRGLVPGHHRLGRAGRRPAVELGTEAPASVLPHADIEGRTRSPSRTPRSQSRYRPGRLSPRGEEAGWGLRAHGRRSGC